MMRTIEKMSCRHEYPGIHVPTLAVKWAQQFLRRLHDLAYTLVCGYAVDAIIIKQSMLTVPYIVTMLVVLLLIRVLDELGQIIAEGSFQMSGPLRLGRSFLMKILRMPHERYCGEASGIRMLRINDDPQTVLRHRYNVIANGTSCLVNILVTMLIMLHVAPLLAAIMITTAALLSMVGTAQLGAKARGFAQKLRPVHEECSNRKYELLTTLREHMLLRAERKAIMRFLRAHKPGLVLGLRLNVVHAVREIIHMLRFRFLSEVAVYAVGAGFVAVGRTTPGIVLILARCLKLLLYDTNALVCLYLKDKQLSATIDRLRETAFIPNEGGMPDTVEKTVEDVSEQKRIALVIHNLRFTHKESGELFRGCSLNLCKGEVVVVRAPSGTGKTTLVELIAGLRRPSSGAITVGGHGVQPSNLRRIRRCMHVVTQERGIMGLPIHRAVTVGLRGTIDESRLNRALEQSCLDDDIRRLPLGIHTPLDPTVHNLSGGQLQRLSLVRVFLEKRPLVILDEPTANLDAITEEKIVQNLVCNCRESAVLIFSHSDRVARYADRVVQIFEGLIISSPDPSRTGPGRDILSGKKLFV